VDEVTQGVKKLGPIKRFVKKESREFGVQSSESTNGILKKNLRTPN
jgi:hypothetical protein